VAFPSGGTGKLLDRAPWAGGTPTVSELDRDSLESGQARLLCPVSPSKIIGIGRNYKKHAEELKNEVPEQPLMFFKPPSSLVDPGGTVELPPESERVDYEGELLVVIGRRCRRVSTAEAARSIFGYSIACDVTARDLQQKDKQWTRAKGFDTFCPVGPYVIPLADPNALGLQLSVNGAVRQDGNTRDMIFDIPTLIAYASNAMTLEPGDVILTGTPEGVGPLSHGDVVSIRIEGLGELTFGVTGPS
jgi:2-keto-4-pentenoate hydratase/2-oxohepta-3-ene-1,7-dioic acid hydratase in catechol pathway